MNFANHLCTIYHPVYALSVRIKFGNHTTIVNYQTYRQQLFKVYWALANIEQMAVLGPVCVVLFLKLLIFSNLANAGGKMKDMNLNSTENFTIECDSLVTGSLCDSLTLSQIAGNSTQATHVYIDIKIPQLLLSGTVEFEYHESVTITGRSTVISCQERNSGLMFANVTEKVTVVNIVLTNCGHTDGKLMYYYAFCLLQCRDIYFNNVSAVKNRGTAVSIQNHQGGTVYFSNCSFIENSIASDENNENRGGGGIYIGDFDHDPSIPTMYYFIKCRFVGNIPHTRFYYYLYTNEVGQSISGYGRGGGVFLSFQSKLTNIEAAFTECIFSGNKGFLGGGLAVVIQGDEKERTGNISVTVNNSLFEANGCSSENQTGHGGGAHLCFSTKSRLKLSHNRIYFTNVTFSRNCAAIGGGVYFYSNHRESKKELNSIIFENCTFIENKAYIGTALVFTPNIFDRLTEGFLLVPILKYCRFMSNVHIQSKTAFSTGTLYSSQYTIKFTGHTMFYNNSGTALYIVNGLADFSVGNVTFLSNRGVRGGALALIGKASLIVGRKGNYSFINNTAVDRGGAIYVLMIDRLDYALSKSCFMKYHNTKRNPISNWKAIDMMFLGNRASANKGHAIFATSLYPCQVINNGTTCKSDYVVANISDVFSVRNIKFDDNPKPQVATEGGSLHHNGNLPLQIIPGENYNHGVTLSDDLGNLVEATLQASISNTSDVALSSEFSSCLSDEITLKGELNQSALLSLQTISLRQTFIEFEVKLLDCPPGFIIERRKCVCNAHLYSGFLRCDSNSFHGFLHSGFWTGLVKDKFSGRTELATGFCPSGFCDYNGSKVSTLGIKLPKNVSLLDKAICGKSRTGVLCGECREGYTTYFHSPNFLCKPTDPALCKVGWLFYILSELVPVTVVFITVLVLNVSFTSGAVNGFILFSQLITSLNINADGLAFPNSTAEIFIVTGYQVLYGVFNLDYFSTETISFCLWNGASALDMIAFKYITITYALLLVAVIIWFMNKCGGRCLGKWYRITKLKSSVIHGITTFLVICYAQCVNVSLTLLIRHHYIAKAGSDLDVPDIVWLNGNLVYFSGKHLLYALPALFCLITIGILPPIFLLSYPLLNKILSFFGLEGSKFIKFMSQRLPISSLKPLFDSFQGCFKDNLRFFAGLYFLYRWIGLAVNASVSNYITYYTTVEILLLCVLALHAICQPYTRRAHNIVDTLLFTDLAIINAISIANYYRNQNYVVNLPLINISFMVQLVLIYLPMCVMIAYVLIQTCKRSTFCVSYSEAFVRNISSSKILKLRSFMRFNNGRSSGEYDSNYDDELPHRLVADADYRNFEESEADAREPCY